MKLPESNFTPKQKKQVEKVNTEIPVESESKPVKIVEQIATRESDESRIAEIKRSLQEQSVQNSAKLSEPSGVLANKPSLEVHNVHKFYN